ncbi:POU domain protein 1, partial [Trichinella spiralis]|uniref:POU domain protein 1 n=1 Tax=Trichinella spiralis TaxID=6334 RepID=UPI0001EFDC62
FTQQQVGDALGLRYNSYFSQTTISRFEDLNLSVRNMNKLRPLIQQWIIDTERMFEDESNGEQALTSGRRRRKRTTFGGELRSFLEEVFQANPRPSAGQISSLALKLNLDVEVVRVWFCNRRQREARLNLNSF